uniref:Uncharacterized protein n=1 Tax=Musa acuminata subsp. malaccensis TaxID=214687 RepID=A0A804KX67_MUSAM
MFHFLTITRYDYNPHKFTKEENDLMESINYVGIIQYYMVCKH